MSERVAGAFLGRHCVYDVIPFPQRVLSQAAVPCRAEWMTIPPRALLGGMVTFLRQPTASIVIEIDDYPHFISDERGREQP